MIEDLASDYANYMKVDVRNELRDVQDTIDDMLTRLDEFENLVNMVKTDSELCADLSIPLVLSSKQKLDSLCNQIDFLEKFVSRVKSDMDIIQMQVDEAEAEMVPTGGKLKNIFKPLFSKKSPNEIPGKKQTRGPNYEPPTIFSTSSFFPSSNKDTDTVQKEQEMS